MSLLFCGIEGGGTHSTAVILDVDGNKLGELLNETSLNHLLSGQEECCEKIITIIHRVMKESGIDDSTALAGLGLCMSGCEDEKTNEELRLLMKSKMPQVQEIVVASDTKSPLTAASTKGGIVLIAGTGSNCLLINPDGSSARCGGWGYMLGDEGSAYWLSYKAVKICMLEQDNYEQPPFNTTCVWETIKQHFDIEDRFGLLQYSHGDFNKSFYSGLAVRLAEGAEKGDKLCQHLFKWCGEELGKHVAAVADEIHPELYEGDMGVPIVCVGSVWKSWKHLQHGFLSALNVHGEGKPKVKKFSLIRLNVSSSVGAAILSAQNFNIPIDLEKNITVFYRFSPNEINGIAH